MKNTQYIKSFHFKSDSVGPNIANNFVFSFPSAKGISYYQMSLKLHMPFILWILIETLSDFLSLRIKSPTAVLVYSILSLLLTRAITIIYICVCICACSVAQLCMTLCDPMDCSLPDFSVHGTSQSRILEWVAIFFCRRSSWPRNQTCVSCLAGRFFITELPGKPLHIYKSLHICIYIHISMLCEAICICVYPHIHTCVYIYVCVCVCVCVCTECLYSS